MRIHQRGIDMMCAEDAAPTFGLAVRLKEGTRRAHRWIERLTFVRSFLRGVLDGEQYQRLLVDLYYIYATLESALVQHQKHPAVAPMVLPQLFRTHSIAADLDVLASRGIGRAWRMQPMSHAALLYTQRLRQLSEQRPELLVAHCYTRYLGDLSGGQILRRMAGLALGLGPSGGLSFYDFPQVTEPAQFKKEFRSRLDALPLSEAQRADVIAEAVRAFGLSGALFDVLPTPSRLDKTGITSARA